MITENTDEILTIGRMKKQEMSKEWSKDRSARILTNRHEICEILGGIEKCNQ